MTAEKDAPAPAGRYELGDLVLKRKEELRLSYEKLAARCIDPETGTQTVKPSWLHRIATREKVLVPDYPALCGLAAGLEVPLSVVQEAAGAQFWRVNPVYSPDRQVRALVHDVEGMSEEDLARVRAIIDAYRRT